MVHTILAMLIDDEILLSRFRKAIRVHGEENILDLDASLDHKIDFQIFKFEDVLRGTNRIIPPNRWSHHRIGLIKKVQENLLPGYIIIALLKIRWLLFLPA